MTTLPNRHPLRILAITNKLRRAWELVPDWRLGQLVSNLLGPGPHDVFHPSDDEWDQLLDRFIYERTGENPPYNQE